VPYLSSFNSIEINIYSVNYCIFLLAISSIVTIRKYRRDGLTMDILFNPNFKGMAKSVDLLGP
jgi:hypothetical protein